MCEIRGRDRAVVYRVVDRSKETKIGEKNKAVRRISSTRTKALECLFMLNILGNGSYLNIRPLLVHVFSHSASHSNNNSRKLIDSVVTGLEMANLFATKRFPWSGSSGVA